MTFRAIKRAAFSEAEKRLSAGTGSKLLVMSGTTEVGAITSCGASKLPGRGTRNSSATFKSSNILCTTVPELIISLSFTVAGPTPPRIISSNSRSA